MILYRCLYSHNIVSIISKNNKQLKENTYEAKLKIKLSLCVLD